MKHKEHKDRKSFKTWAKQKQQVRPSRRLTRYLKFHILK